MSLFNYTTFSTLQNEFYPTLCAAQHVSKEKYEVLIFAKIASKRNGGSCGMISYSVLNRGKLAACRLYRVTKLWQKIALKCHFTLYQGPRRHTSKDDTQMHMQFNLSLCLLSFQTRVIFIHRNNRTIIHPDDRIQITVHTRRRTATQHFPTQILILSIFPLNLAKTPNIRDEIEK